MKLPLNDDRIISFQKGFTAANFGKEFVRILSQKLHEARGSVSKVCVCVCVCPKFVEESE